MVRSMLQGVVGTHRQYPQGDIKSATVRPFRGRFYRESLDWSLVLHESSFCSWISLTQVKQFKKKLMFF